VVKDGQVTFEKSMNIRFSYDERIEDGLSAYDGIKSILKVLEEPEKYLGSLKEDASQSKTFGELARSLTL
jgi:pyruvate/2-oxoglutarate dehydrogenase complex dihydrolipoamide acyltransferase (E2) component